MIALGLDIGGANLKAADSSGNALSEAFEIWRAPGELATRLRELIARFPAAGRLAVTMTAELADCFATKTEGVGFIVGAVREAAAVIPAAIWSTAGEFVSCDSAVARPMAVAAANWHALATWAGRFAPHGRALLTDIGSTTSDIIPLENGRPVARGLTDLERLLNHELVYAGIRRTPLCALASAVPVRGRLCPVAAEFFSTALDIYLLLGLIPEDSADVQTADGRPATIARAHDRISRMVCCDREEIDLDEARSIASHFAEAQQKRLSSAIGNVIGREAGPLDTVILSGSGELLARKIVAENPWTRGSRVVRLSETLSGAIAEAACAHAVAMLALDCRL
jgi:probable H4MPT-linked C1 transfer pathway protein